MSDASNISIKAFDRDSIVEAGDFCMNRSPWLPCSNAYKTSSTASSRLIINLVIFGSVIVKSFLFSICSMKRGITEPLEAITFPYLVIQIKVS